MTKETILLELENTLAIASKGNFDSAADNLAIVIEDDLERLLKPLSDRSEGSSLGGKYAAEDFGGPEKVSYVANRCQIALAALEKRDKKTAIEALELALSRWRS